jgi:uncharacterized protein YqeY
MEIKEKMMNDLKEAMKAKDQVRLDAIRFLQAAIKNKEIDSRPNPITADDVLAVIKKMIKQRKESIEQYQNAGRTDLVEKETKELNVIEAYLPPQMSKEQVEAIVTATITELKAASVKDMGPVMKAVIAKTAGQADNKLVSELIKAKLNP